MIPNFQVLSETIQFLLLGYVRIVKNIFFMYIQVDKYIIYIYVNYI